MIIVKQFGIYNLPNDEFKQKLIRKDISYEFNLHTYCIQLDGQKIYFNVVLENLNDSYCNTCLNILHIYRSKSFFYENEIIIDLDDISKEPYDCLFPHWDIIPNNGYNQIYLILNYNLELNKFNIMIYLIKKYRFESLVKKWRESIYKPNSKNVKILEKDFNDHTEKLIKN